MASIYINKKLTELQKEIDIFIIIEVDFNILLSITGRKIKQNINLYVDLNNVINKVDINNIYRIWNSKIKEFIFFSKSFYKN